VATIARCDGIFNIYLTTNLLRNLPVNFLNRFRFDKIVARSTGPHFFGPPCIWVIHFNFSAFVLFNTRVMPRTITSMCQLPTCAVNVALPAFAATRRAAAPCCCGAGRSAIDRYLLPAGPRAANPSHAAGERDRRTDGQMDAHRIVPFRRPWSIGEQCQ